MPDSRRNTFDSVACRYDEIRPGYPDELIDDIECLSGIPDDGRILEIGCGTGHATSQHLSSCFRTAPFERYELGLDNRDGFILLNIPDCRCVYHGRNCEPFH